jgi:hypothetical protein
VVVGSGRYGGRSGGRKWGEEETEKGRYGGRSGIKNVLKKKHLNPSNLKNITNV